MPASDVAFTFNPQPIQNGIRKASAAMEGFENTAKSVSRGVTKGITRLATRVGALAGSFFAVRGAIRQMPEIGQAFSMAGDVISNNLLFPIREELFPILQSMLDWVRTHRATFTAWGEALAGVFRSAVELGKAAFEIIRNLGQAVSDAMGGLDIFSRSMEDTLNLFQFKIAATATFLRLMVEPVSNFFERAVDYIFPRIEALFSDVVSSAGEFWGYIKDIAGSLVEIIDDIAGSKSLWEDIGSLLDNTIRAALQMVDSFLKGIKQHSEDFGNNIEDIVESFDRMLENWTTATEEGNSLKTVFRELGDFVGQVAEGISNLAAQFTEGFVKNTRDLMDPMQGLADALSRISDVLFGDNAVGKGLSGLANVLGSAFGKAVMTTVQGLARAFDVLATSLEVIQDILTMDWQGMGKGIAGFAERAGGTLSDIFEADWIENLVNKSMQNLAPSLRPGGSPETTDFRGTGATGSFEQVDDALVTPEGRVIKFDPNDYIMATKSPGGFGGASVNVDMSGTTIQVTEGNAERAGAEFAGGIARRLRDEILADKTRRGD